MVLALGANNGDIVGDWGFRATQLLNMSRPSLIYFVDNKKTKFMQSMGLPGCRSTLHV